MNNDLLKTKEQLIRELKNLRKKSKKKTDKLLASNQQLAASEQQLRATNQQLSAGEQQLRATNQQLQATNQQLSASEKELKYQYYFLQKVIDAVPARIFWKDQNSVYLGCNKAFVNDCGKNTHQEVIGQNDDVMIWKTDADVYRADDQEVMNKKTPKLKYEEPFINKNGEQVIWRTSKVPLKNDIGEVIGLLATSENITEEKKAEAVLKQKQYHLENAQELGKIGSWDLDIEKNELIWTNENYRIFGVPIGTPMNYELFLSRVHPDDREYVNKKWNAAMCGNDAYDINHRLLMDNGEVKWVREKADLIFDNNGKCLRGTGFAQNVTERKQAEQKLKESEEKFRGVFEDSNVGIAIGSAQGDVVEVNKEYLKITGYSRNEFIGINYADFTHPEDLKKERTLIEELQNGERENFRIEKRVLAKKGSYLWLDTAITGQRKENGELDKLIVMVIDITEGKKATETVNVFFDQPMNIHLIGSIEGKILKVNRGWEETLGYTKKESVGKNIFDFVHPDDKESSLNELGELQKGKTTFYFENRYKHKNGTYVTLAWSAIFNTSGKMLHGVAKDITQQKAYHKQLVQSEERYKALSENANHIILTHNFDGEITYANKFGLNFINLKKEQVIGTNIKLLIQDKEELEKMQQRIKDFMSGNFKVHQYELNITLPSGDKKILEVIGSPIKLNNKIDSVLLTAYDITEREKARLKLADSETKLKNIVENSTNLFYTHTVDNKITFISPQVKEFLGYEPEDVMQHWTEFITDNPRNRKAFENTDKAIQTGRRQPTYEIEMQRKDGKKIIVEVREAPVVVNGEVESIVGSLADITERKKAENKLRESEEKLRLAIDNSPLGITINDMEGNFVSVNKAYEKMVGYSKDELLQMNFFDLTHPDYLPKNRELFGNMATKKASGFAIDKKYIHKKGKLIDVRIHAGSINDENGKPLFGMAFTEDITERIKAEENLKNFSRKLQLLTKSANIGIWEFDLKKNILSWDKQMFELYGITPDEVGSSYETWQKCVHPDDLERIDKEVHDAIAGKKNYHTQFRAVWPNGELRHIEAHAIATRDPDGNPRSMIGVNWDITAIKNTERNLINAKLKAEESDRLKSAFLSNMSHEIRTPMNGILGFTSLLKEPQLAENTRDKYIQIIEKSGNRLLNTINDIVDISKIEAGQVEVSKKELSVNKLLLEQFNFFLRETEAKGLKLIYKPIVSDSDSLIISDQHKLESILTNLIKNAIKYTESGSITFGYTIKSVEGKDVCEFYVKDTGIGIPANRIEAIFNRFEQADIEDTRVFEGSGLGLAIAKSYVEMLGGTITVSSEEGNGSTFTFNIPYIKQNQKESGSKQNGEEGAGVSLKNLSIIVAEDDAVSKMLLETILENEYSKIIYTSTGKETINKCRENPDTDIILMDIKMPDMNGFSATKLIREFNQNVIIIAQTAYGLSGDKEKAFEVGCDDYIAKPIKKEILLEKIQVCLNELSR